MSTNIIKINFSTIFSIYLENGVFKIVFPKIRPASSDRKTETAPHAAADRVFRYLLVWTENVNKNFTMDYLKRTNICYSNPGKRSTVRINFIAYVCLHRTYDVAC